MPTLSAIQIYNELANGTLDAAGLDTLISTGGKLSNFQELRGEPSYVRGLLASDSAWSAIKNSNGISSITAAPTSMRYLANNTVRLPELLSDRPAVIRGAFYSGGNQGLLPYYTFAGKTNTPVAFPTIMNGVAYGANLFVAVGNGGTILTSPDGTTWTRRVSGTTNNFQAIIYANSIFVAVGTTNLVVTSTDGITWVVRTNAIGNAVSIAYGAGLFVVASTQTSLYTSPDGITWTARSGVLVCNQIIFANGKFVGKPSSAAASVTVSTDGITWATQTVPSTSYAIAAGAGFFAVVSTAGTIYTSATALTGSWTLISASSIAATNVNGSRGWSLNGIAYLQNASNQIFSSVDGTNWLTVANPAAQISNNGVASNGTIGVATNNNATSILFDGNWQNLRTSAGGALQCQTNTISNTYSVNSKIYANSTNQVSVSADGINWGLAFSANTSRTDATGVAFGNGIYVAASRYATDGIIEFWRSTDGYSWTRSATIVTGTVPYSIIFGGGNFYVFSNGSSNPSYISADGITWESIGNSFDLARAATDTNTVVVIVNTNIFYRTQISASFVTVSGVFGSRVINDVSYGDGLFLAVSDQASGTANTNGGIATSPDGINWTYRSKVSNTDILKSVCYKKGVCLVGTSTGLLYSSTDFVNWTLRPNGFNSTTSINGIEHINGIYALAGTNGVGFLNI